MTGSKMPKKIVYYENKKTRGDGRGLRTLAQAQRVLRHFAGGGLAHNGCYLGVNIHDALNVQFLRQEWPIFWLEILDRSVLGHVYVTGCCVSPAMALAATESAFCGGTKQEIMRAVEACPGFSAVAWEEDELAS